MTETTERMRILEMIDSGQITAEDGLRLLADLPDDAVPDDVETASQPQEQPIEMFSANELPADNPSMNGAPELSAGSTAAAGGASTQPSSEPVRPEIVGQPQREDFERWKLYWLIPVGIGIGITIFGGLLMYWALQSSGMGFWFFCAMIPFAIGVLILAMGASSRTAHWLHLRVQQAPGERPQRIAISFPIPIGLAAWFFRTFRTKISGMENVPPNMDEILYAMRDSTSQDNPIYIRVDDDEDGDKVEIYIG